MCLQIRGINHHLFHPEPLSLNSAAPDDQQLQPGPSHQTSGAGGLRHSRFARFRNYLHVPVWCLI